jgi:uncharacterized membrane protein YhaH (DUF805 family)
MGWLAFLFSWKGRFTRLQFAIMYFASGLPFVAIGLGAMFLSDLRPDIPRDLTTAIFVTGYALSAYLQTGNVVKRLHDLGLSGWWLAAMVALLGVSFGIVGLFGFMGSTQAMIVIAPVMIVAVIGTFALMFTPGMPKANRYGPDPLGRDWHTFGPSRAEGS